VPLGDELKVPRPDCHWKTSRSVFAEKVGFNPDIPLECRLDFDGVHRAFIPESVAGFRNVTLADASRHDHGFRVPVFLGTAGWPFKQTA
jgi:hypothetical protein